MKNYFKKSIALDSRLTTCHLKILLLLDIEEYNQSELTMLLNLHKQYINKHVKELEKWGYIEISKQLGNIKYLKLGNLSNIEFNGQLKLV